MQKTKLMHKNHLLILDKSQLRRTSQRNIMVENDEEFNIELSTQISCLQRNLLIYFENYKAKYHSHQNVPFL